MTGVIHYKSQRKKAGAHLFFNAFWLIQHFCINLMYMRDTMHQIDSGVIISFLKAFYVSSASVLNCHSVSPGPQQRS